MIFSSVRMYAADVRDGWEVRTSSLIAALTIAVLARRAFRIDCGIDTAYTNDGTPITIPAVPYVFDRRC